MATLSTSLTITSSDASTDSLSIAVSDTLTIGNPVITSGRVSVATGSATVLLAAADQATDTYFFIKNIDGTNYIEVKTDGAVVFSRLRAGEFLFANIKESTGIEIQANTAACIVEYGYWTNA